MKSRIIVTLLPIVLMFFGSRAQAANYAVKAAGAGTFSTIQACANAAAPGDICTVFAGTYQEYVNPPTSGTSAAPITFTVNAGDNVKVSGFTISKNYIVVSGFEIYDPTFSESNGVLLNSVTGVQILNNTIHQVGTSQCIKMAYGTTSSYTVIKSNTISWCAATPQTNGGGAAILINGDHNLVDTNDISHVTDFVQLYGSFNVVRNNQFHDVNAAVDFPLYTGELHIDAMESECVSPQPALIHVLIERNTVENILGVGGAHAWLFQDSSSPCGSHGAITRFNTVHNLGTGYLYDDLGGFYGVKDYNNTVVTLQTQMSPKECGIATFIHNSTKGAMINDIIYDAVSNNCEWIDTDPTTLLNFVGKNNLGYLPSCGTGCIYLAPFSTMAGNILNKNPLFVNSTSDWHLQSASPARGAGTYLTTVAAGDSGSGIALVVNDAGFFQDGSGIPGVRGDSIKVGSASPVQISSVNYTTDTITLANPINRSFGDPVYLYADSGRNIVLLNSNPDMGAHQSANPGQSTQPAPPTGLTIAVH